MRAAETAERLLVGSHNIDLMRIKINETIKMLVGYVLRCKNWEHSVTSPVLFESDSCDCKWVLERDIFPLLDPKFTCQMKSSYGWNRIFSSPQGGIPLQTRYVQRVYGSLQVLVEGLIKTFPELEEEWKPLMDASFVELSA